MIFYADPTTDGVFIDESNRGKVFSTGIDYNAMFKDAQSVFLLCERSLCTRQVLYEYD
jgi:hypothetical protein